jgi:hypothetical protein
MHAPADAGTSGMDRYAWADMHEPVCMMLLLMMLFVCVHAPHA